MHNQVTNKISTILALLISPLPALLAPLLLTAKATADDQPQWGQAWSRNMVSNEKGLPDSFDPKTGKNIKWTARIGNETHATPVIAKGKVLIGTNNGAPRDPQHKGDRGVLMCFNEKDGEFLWQLVVPKVTDKPYWDWANAGFCSPATVEGDRIYIPSNRGEVMCLDPLGMANGNDGPFRDEARHMAVGDSTPIEPGAKDGDILWLYDVTGQLNVRQHDSTHSSILPHGRFLYVNTSNGVDDSHRFIASPDAPSLIVIDKTTGQLAARDNEHIGPRIFHCTWSSPAFGEVNGKPLIIFGGGDGVLYAFEPLADTAIITSSPVTLKKVWQFDCDPTGPKENVHRFTSNRKESPSNIKSMPVFYKNRVYVTVGGDLWWGKNQAWLKCIDATKTGDITRTAELWSYPLERHCMSTPAIHDGLAYAADCGGKIHCVDAETGQPYWTHQAKGEMWASTLVADGKVYIGTRRGWFYIFAAGKEKKVLSEIEIGDPISGSPIAANGVLYVTTQKCLYAVAQPPVN
ncbi:MAG: PQQ-binding-like beta-propeller repeat protein [Candidatus Sumerlaeota bacterium]|nr:PQQ-binding-like beta-propeller repeat protein [Candidatus Sumerlaeota bacterium]